MSEQQPPGPPFPGPPAVQSHGQYGHQNGQQYGQQYSPHQRPPKQRPRALWFAVGGVLLVLGIVIGVAVIATAVKDVTRTDGVVTGDGKVATIVAPPNERRMLFVESGHVAPNCDLADGSGTPLLKRAIFGEATVTTDGTEWKAFARIDSSGDGNVQIVCTPVTGDVARVRMGEPLDVRSVGGAVLAGIGSLLLLGGCGFVVLLVTTILWVTRKPPPTTQPTGPPTTQPTTQP